MAVPDKTTDKKNIAIILAVLGVILVIIGATIHDPLRGSGMGTLSFIAGLVLLVISVYLMVAKRS
jgi:hypothetical protein